MKRKRRNKFKVFTLVLAAFVTLSLSSTAVYAEEEITRTAEFTSESKSPQYSDFPSELEDNGDVYKLGDVTCEKTGEEKKTARQDKTTTVNKTGLKSKSYSVGATESITVDGKNYTGTVTDVKYRDRTARNRTGEVSGTENYGLRVDKPTPPSSKSLPYYDNLTGQSFNVDAPLTRLEETNSQWQDYTYIDIVVSNYTDSQFMFNDKIIHHNGSTVLDSSYYPELLSMAGLNGNSYKISSINWIGDSYKSGNVRYRNARANIQAYSCSYTAHYYKSFSLSDVPLYDAEITYSYSQENVIKTVYKYRATAHYSLVKTTEAQTEKQTEVQTTEEITTVPQTQPQTEPSKEEPITVQTVTTISLILVLSLAFVLLGFFLLTKIKSKNTKLSQVLNKKRKR